MFFIFVLWSIFAPFSPSFTEHPRQAASMQLCAVAAWMKHMYTRVCKQKVVGEPVVLYCRGEDPGGRHSSSSPLTQGTQQSPTRPEHPRALVQAALLSLLQVSLPAPALQSALVISPCWELPSCKEASYNAYPLTSSSLHPSPESTGGRGALAARPFIPEEKQSPLAATAAAPHGTNYSDSCCASGGGRLPAPPGDAPPGFASRSQPDPPDTRGSSCQNCC